MDDPSAAWPPRKYYTLTAAGDQRRDALAVEWIQLTQAVTELQSYLAVGTSTGGAQIILSSGADVGAATSDHDP